jgi:hypothetical protein
LLKFIPALRCEKTPTQEFIKTTFCLRPSVGTKSEVAKSRRPCTSEYDLRITHEIGTVPMRCRPIFGIRNSRILTSPAPTVIGRR